MGMLDDIKTLRERTQAPMMDCKKALGEAGGNVEKAIDILREKGIAKASKKAGRETTEGRIGVTLSDDKKKAVMVKLACETDFVAKNKDFIAISEDLSRLALEKNFTTKEELMGGSLNGNSVEEHLKASVGKIGENIQIADVETFESEKGLVDAYKHMGSKLVVLVEVASDGNNTNKLAELAHELAMQIAVDNPEYVKSSEIPEDVVDKERKIIAESDELSGKPDNIKDRIIDGKIKSFFKTCCLLDLPYMRESKMLVSELVDKTSKEIGSPVDVVKFKRVEIGK